MRLFSNVGIYDKVGGLYDATLGFWSREVRGRAAGALSLDEGERLLIVGVGSGMELEYLPAWTRGVGVDLSPGMLGRARLRRARRGMRNLDLRVMDARRLEYPDGSFEAVYLPLIVTVVGDGPRVLAEAARVTAPGGRLVIADRFWPEDRARPAAARAASWVLGHFAMRFDHRFSEILAGAPSLEIEGYERTAPRGFFHLVTLRKPGGVRDGGQPEFGVGAGRVAPAARPQSKRKGTMNAKRVLDVLAVIFVGDGLLWVVAPRRRGLVWLAGPPSVKRFVEEVTLERPWLSRLLGAAQVAAGAWMARRAYSRG